MFVIWLCFHFNYSRHGVSQAAKVFAFENDMKQFSLRRWNKTLALIFIAPEISAEQTKTSVTQSVGILRLADEKSPHERFTRKLCPLDFHAIQTRRSKFTDGTRNGLADDEKRSTACTWLAWIEMEQLTNWWLVDLLARWACVIQLQSKTVHSDGLFVWIFHFWPMSSIECRTLWN